MLITKIRSSSVATYNMCPMKHYIEYNLGYKLPPTNDAAAKGTALHKAMEILGLRQLAIQEGKNEFYEEEIDKIYKLDLFKLEDAVHDALSFYINKKKSITTDVIPEVLKLFNTAITDYAHYTPIKRKIHAIEHHFDFNLDFDWAKYNFIVGNEKYEGQLALHGTIDLLMDTEDGGLELCDYKSSKTRNDWATGKEKNTENLLNDFQLMLYYYAIRKCFPQVSHIMTTILFIRAGGPYTPAFTDDDLPRIEKRIQQEFETIKNDKKPHMIKKEYGKAFKCGFCSFKTTNFPGTKKSYCDFFEKEIISLGMDKVTDKYMDKDSFGAYEGGGRSSRII